MSDKLIYIGNFGEVVDSQDDTYTKRAELFSTGTHRGIEYTEEDLNQLVNEFNAEEEIPVQLDHSQSARDTVGYLKSVFSEGGKLMGDLEIIDDYAKERIDKKLMKKLSVSFYLKHSEAGLKPHKLREVSLVAFPQVKGARLFSENGYISDYEEEKGGNKDMAKEETKAEFSQEQITELIANYKELETKVAELASVKKEFSETQITHKIEKFQEDNKVIPAQVDTLNKLLTSFSEEQANLFDEFMTNSAKVDFSEQGEFEGQEHENDKKKEDPAKDEFDKFYEEHSNKYGVSL